MTYFSWYNWSYWNSWKKNSAPEFKNLPSDGMICIDENQTFVMDVDARDSDGDSLTYSIVGGADSGKFVIDPSTGVLSFKNAPDFENPTDKDGNNKYDVKIQVSDGKGCTTEKTLWVVVKDVPETGWIKGRLTFDDDCNDNEWNDETGQWDRGVEGKTVQLVDLSGNVVAESVTDAYGNYMFDVPAGDYRVKFPLPEGFMFSAKDSGVDDHFDSDAGPDGLTDVITVVAGKSIYNVDAGIKEKGFDLDPDALTVCEDDGPTDLDVTLNDSIPEGATITLTDVSQVPGGTISMSPEGILTFDPGDDFQSLKVGESTSFDVTYTVTTEGSAATPITVEAEDLYLCDFKVVSGDQASGGKLIKLKDDDGYAILKDFEGDKDTYSLSLFVQDENDGCSKIKLYVNGDYVEAIRLDRNSDGSGSDDGGFSEFVIEGLDLKPGDDIKIKAWQDGGEYVRIDKLVFTPSETAPSETKTETVTITVEGKNDGPVAAPDAFVTDEDTAISGDLLANDSDIDGDPLSIVGIDGGSIGTAFTAVSQNGREAEVIVFSGGAVNILFDPNDGFEDLNDGQSDTVVLTYTISDGNGGTASSTATITVNGITDNTPPIIAEPVVFDVLENTTFVGDLEGADPDGDILTFRIIGGDDASFFTIDELTGELEFINAPDFETPLDLDGDNRYDLFVEVSDGLASSSSLVTAIVIDVPEDVPPVANDDLFETDEGVLLSANLLANDTDDNGDPLTITAISGGTIGTSFSVVTDGGRTAEVFVTASGSVNFLFDPLIANFADLGTGDTDSVTLSYTVTDGLFTDTADVTVVINGVNNPPIIAEPVVFAVDENTVGFTGQLVGADPDSSILTFEIIGGEDAALFDLDESTGALTLLTTPDFEAPADFDGDNNYNVIVQVSDGEASASSLVTFEVQDVNEAPIIVNPVSTLLFNTDFDANTVLVYDVDAIDPEGDEVLFSLTGRDAAILSIDSQGRITSADGEPLEASDRNLLDNQIQVTVVATDVPGGNTDQFDLVLDQFVTVG